MSLLRRFLLGLGLLAASAAHAATPEDYATCTLVYGALFQAGKDMVDHAPTLAYVQPRIHALLPWLKENEPKPQVKQLMQQKSAELRQEVLVAFTRNVKVAIGTNDAALLKSSFTRVFACDKALGFKSPPLPSVAAPTWDQYAKGVFTGCEAKQRSASRGVTPKQIEIFCTCTANAVAANGLTAEDGDQTSEVFRRAVPGCAIAAGATVPDAK